jgi:hypothetical protein
LDGDDFKVGLGDAAVRAAGGLVINKAANDTKLGSPVVLQ